jgi:hypothetical protein
MNESRGKVVGVDTDATDAASFAGRARIEDDGARPIGARS